MDWTQTIQILLLIVLMVGLAGIIVALNYMVGDKDNLQNIQKNTTIIVGTSSVMLLLVAIFVYIYIRINPQAFVPFMLIISFLSLEAALTAVSVSILQKTS